MSCLAETYHLVILHEVSKLSECVPGMMVDIVFSDDEGSEEEDNDSDGGDDDSGGDDDEVRILFLMLCFIRVRFYSLVTWLDVLHCHYDTVSIECSVLNGQLNVQHLHTCSG